MYAESLLPLRRIYTKDAIFWHAPVVKLVDTPDLGSGASRRVGSSPIRRTIGQKRRIQENFPLCFYILRLQIIISLSSELHIQAKFRAT